MTSQIPDEVRDAIRAELDADTAEYRDQVPEGAWVKPNRCSSQVLTLRIPVDILEALQEYSLETGVSVSATARNFIADGLASHRGDDLRSALERLERDVATVKARALAS